MSTNRMRLAVAGTALAVASSLTSVTTALADEPATTAGAKEERIITIKGVEPRPDVFIAKGRVKPGYKNRKAIMQRKLRSENKWGKWKTFKTNDNSRYRTRIAPLKRRGVVCYRVRIPGNKNFKDAVSSKVCIKTY